jgi:DNA-binding NarL/FixJ family response regulator
MIHKAKILILDDEPQNIQIIMNILAEYSEEHVIYQSNNADLAVSIAKKVTPDLIITDWDMPGKNGIDFIEDLKRNTKLKEIPVIMASGIMTSSDHLKKALDVGANDFITKPVDETELIARVNSSIRLSETQQQLIKQKDSELTEKTLAIVRNNEFNKKISKKLERALNAGGNEKVQTLIGDVIQDVENKIKSDDLQHFETSFNAVYDSFYKNLTADYPKLTQNDLKLCAYLKLGLSSKDIAAVMFINKDSVKTARSRLRKKLEIESNANLQSFLSNY